MFMTPQEHTFKEMLKMMVDNGPNYSAQIKGELKAIIDAGNTPEEIAVGFLTFIATIPR